MKHNGPNDSAFPVSTPFSSEGLTTREYFAAAALQGILANPAWNRASLEAAGFREGTNEALRAAAFLAFAHADHMLAEAARQPAPP